MNIFLILNDALRPDHLGSYFKKKQGSEVVLHGGTLSDSSSIKPSKKIL